MSLALGIGLGLPFRGEPFSPAALFANGEQGAWFEADTARLFQDTAAASPVTATGQTVGRVNDRSGAGLNATQATAGSRPTYALVPQTGRRNLLVYSEEFNNGSGWSQSGIDFGANAVVAPDGTTTAETLTAQAITSTHRVVASAITLASAQPVVLSVYLKAGTHSLVQIHDGASVSYFANFNLSTGVAGTATGCTSSITSVGNGWYRCSIAYTSNAANPTLAVGMVTATNSARNQSWAATGSETVHIWGAQIDNAAAVTAYQKVVTAFNISEAGVYTVPHLLNTGSNTITWTAPAGTYTVARVNSSGTVTIQTGQALTGATNMLLDTRTTAYVAVNRALTVNETSRLTTYLRARAGV